MGPVGYSALFFQCGQASTAFSKINSFRPNIDPLLSKAEKKSKKYEKGMELLKKYGTISVYDYPNAKIICNNITRTINNCDEGVKDYVQ